MPKKKDYPKWFSPYIKPCAPSKPTKPSKTFKKEVARRNFLSGDGSPITSKEVKRLEDEGWSLHIESETEYYGDHTPVLVGVKWEEVPMPTYKSQLAGYNRRLKRYEKEKKEYNSRKKEYDSLLKRWKEEEEKENFERAKKQYKKLKDKYE